MSNSTVTTKQQRNKLIACACSAMMLCVAAAATPALPELDYSAVCQVTVEEPVYETVHRSVSEQAAAAAKVTLEAAGVAPTSFEMLNEDTTASSDYYILFIEASPDGNGGKVSPDDDIILANVGYNGDVTFTSFEEDILSEISGGDLKTRLDQLKAANDIAGIQKMVTDVTGFEVPYCASMTHNFLGELRGNIKESRALPKTEETKETQTAAVESVGGRGNEYDASAQQTVIDDDLWYNQNDFDGYYYQGYYDIPGYGCGLCSTSVALDMLFDVEWDPIYVARHMESWAEENGNRQYCVSAGTAYDPWMKTVEGAFDVEVSRASSIEEVKEALMEGKMIVSGNGGSAFLDSRGNNCSYDGHIICFYKTDGSSVWAKDSAGSCGGSSIKYDADDFEQWWASAYYRTFIIERSSHNQVEPIIAR